MVCWYCANRSANPLWEGHCIQPVTKQSNQRTAYLMATLASSLPFVLRKIFKPLRGEEQGSGMTRCCDAAVLLTRSLRGLAAW